MSLFTTISGITNSQAMLDVIGDNIANINTTGFKSSKINFETVFSNTLSSGAIPTGTSGGINPKQIGLGVTVSDISRNFSRGAVQSTGRSSDLNIQGDGFFTLLDTNGSTVLTRAGNFSADSEGNLVNPKGLKVMGTASLTSNASGTNTVKMPTSLVLTETNNMSNGTTNITPGAFSITVNGTSYSITVEDTDTMQDIANKINTNLTSSTAAINSSSQLVITGNDAVGFSTVVGGSNLPTITAFSTASYTSDVLAAPPATVAAGDVGNFTISLNGGVAIPITVVGTDTYSSVATKINTALVAAGVTSTASFNASNQIVISGPDSVTFTDGTGTLASTAGFTHESYSSSALSDNPQVSIAEGDPTEDNNFDVTSFSISNDGSLEVTYSNGARLTVTTADGDTIRSLKYVSSAGQEITGNPLTVLGAAVVPAQLQIQLARVINPKGLSSIGGNLYQSTSVAGTPVYAIGRQGGMGSIDSGALEASNVDLPTEFASMILAQKAIEANSRAFSVQNQIMDTIVNLAR